MICKDCGKYFERQKDPGAKFSTAKLCNSCWEKRRRRKRYDCGNRKKVYFNSNAKIWKRA